MSDTAGGTLLQPATRLLTTRLHEQARQVAMLRMALDIQSNRIAFHTESVLAEAQNRNDRVIRGQVSL